MWELAVASFVSIASELGTSGGKEAAKQVRAGFTKCFDKSKVSGNHQASSAVVDFKTEPDNEEKQKEMEKVILNLASNEPELASEINNLVKQARSYGLKINIKTNIDKAKRITVINESKIKEGELNFGVESKEVEEFTGLDKVEIGR